MNFEGMSLKKIFWRFVWPSVAAQWIFALYTMGDGMCVARGVSEAALSAVVAIFLRQGRRREANQANTQSTAEYVKHYILSLLPVCSCGCGSLYFRKAGRTQALLGVCIQDIQPVIPGAGI